MNPLPLRRTLWVAALLATSMLAACGGGGGGGGSSGGGDTPPGTNPPDATDRTAPTAMASLASGALEKNEAIVIRFSEAMDAASLRLLGEVGSAAQAAWSRTNADNDTLTLSPQGGAWPTGAGRLLVDAADLAGNALPTLRQDYVVKLLFSDFQAASVVVGQPGFDTYQVNQGGSAARNTLQTPMGNVAVSPDGALFVTDRWNHRILSWASVPSANNAPADLVLGQADFVLNTANTAADRLKVPAASFVGNGKLFVADEGNNRVLIFNRVPTASNAAADLVLGQPGMDSGWSDCAPDMLKTPHAAITTEDGKVLVSDADNNRVLIWNQPPARNGQPPDVVLGQGDGAHCAANDDNQDHVSDVGPTARTLRRPSGIWSDGRRVIVADAWNHRVLIWNTFPTANFEPASVVLGHVVFTNGNENDTGNLMASRKTLRGDGRLYVTSNGVQIAVADSGNHRVLVWNSFPTTNFQPADVILGQLPDWGHMPNDRNGDGTSEPNPDARTMNYPSGVLFHGNKLLVTDSLNNRALVFTAP